MTQRWNGWCLRLGLASSLAIVGALAVSGDCAKAQITPNATPGAESSVFIPLAPGLGFQPSPNNLLYLTSLRCHSTAAGTTNPDQIFLYVNNKLVWGPSSMNAGNVANLNAVTGIDFHKKVHIELFDQSKRLGSAHVSVTGIGQLQFIYGNAIYTLTYQVVADF